MSRVPTSPTTPLIVIGGSAGAIAGLRGLVTQLPSGLPAALLAVVHGFGRHGSNLARLLGGDGHMTVSLAVDGEEIEPGHLYVAGPDRHLIVDGGVLRRVYAAEENRVRPAIDPLFRSAAITAGPQTIGVVLSGNLDDGSAGLLAIRRAGGTTLVQDPDEALYPEMPSSAIAYVVPDAVLPVAGLASHIARLVGAPAREVPPVDPTIAPDGPEFHDISGFTCPQCHGALWVRDLNPMLQYRCRTGHVFSQRTMVSEQDRMVDDALWAAIRSLEEQRALAQRLAGRFEKRGDAAAAARYGRKADVAARRAETLRQVLEPDDDS